MAPSKALKYVIILVACIKTGYTIEQEENFGTTSVTTEVPTTDYSTTVTEQQETTEAVTRTEGPTTVEVDDGTTIVTQGASEVTPSPPLSTFVFEVDPENEGNLQDIDAEETKMYDNLYIHFEPKKFVSQREKAGENEAAESVHITSYIADSETAKPMEMKNGVVSLKRNKSEGADMISAFFVAPDDEVNEIDKNKYSGRPIVVTDLREDLIRTERYSNKDSKPSTNNILAPIRAAVSLSQDDEKLEPPMIEKQELHEAPVYKTIIDIQKSIPYEIKEVEQRDTQQITNDISHQINYQRPLKTPLYYRYPMYYIPQGYIGNYIMRHSHENTGFRQIRPAIIPVQYYIRYPQPQMPQVQAPQAQQLVHVPQIYSGILLGNPYYLGEQSGDTSYETDQNGLQSENKLNYQSHQQQPYPSQHLQQVNHLAPFRPSHSVFSSQYPPYTYRVLSTMRGRGARSAKSKQLCIEYGGFKPPMVPSVQIDDIEKEDPAQEKSIKEETSEN